jgi:hypothetical protein
VNLNLEMTFSDYRGEGELRRDSISRRLRSGNAGSDDCLRLAKRWLDACTGQHGERCQNADLGIVPSRLIDVSPRLESDAVKLVSLPERGNIDYPTSVKYVALSYCWGTEPFLTTTSSNVKAMQQSISPSQLPQMFQDAIRVTRYIGLRYLWIDSLCILQGTDTAAQQDWLFESSKMGQIYHSAYFTLSAESAPAATVGIFNDRPAPPVAFSAIPVSKTGPNIVYLGQHQTSNPTTAEPLHCRGWALQETILSKRLLRFETKQLSWRCSYAEETETRCETQAAHPSNNTTDVEQKVEQKAEPNAQARKIYDSWEKIVENYSQRLLSQQSDKLPAIAGLARVAQEATQDTYVAGVWHRKASRSLLWMHPQRKHEYVRKKEFQAPTWSWASVEGSVCFLRDHVQRQDLVIKFPHTSDSFNSTCKMYVQAWVLPMRTLRRHQFGSYYGEYENFLPWAHLTASLKTYLDDVDAIPPKHRRGEEGDPQELVDSLFLFLADTGTYDRYSGAGLIILPVKKRYNQYSRVGMFKGCPLQGFQSEKNQGWRRYLELSHVEKKPRIRKVVLV